MRKHLLGGSLDTLAASLSTLPSFLIYFGGGAALIASFILIYVNVTPHREFSLMRSGNVAAAIGMAGALLGFVVPLASVIAHSAHFADMIVWGVIALFVQLGGYFCSRLIFPGLAHAIAKGQLSEAIFLASLSLSLGLLTAACMAG